MSDVYTVRMKRKMIVANYDKKGRMTGEITTLIDETYTDLPAKTAMMYRERFPEAQVRIERQAATQDRGKGGVRFGDEKSVRRTKIDGFDKAGTKPVERRAIKKTKPELVPTGPKARTDGYAEVINKIMGER